MSVTKLPLRYISFVILVLVGWAYYMYTRDLFGMIMGHLEVIVTMIFGAFVAGSSPEGSASVAYPIFTLYLDISPSVARNFAFAIQSFGMTAASLMILDRKIPVDWMYIKYVSLAGIVGLVVGTYFISPYILPQFAKLTFVSLWMGFGIVLYRRNRKENLDLRDRIVANTTNDIIILCLLGLVGGVISSIFGTGINIFSFCFVVIYYHLNEKVATPSSVIIMTIETIIGFGLHALIMDDITDESYRMWLSCIPFVIIFAPLGALVMSMVSRQKFNTFLSFIFLIQFVGAMYVIRPQGMTMVMVISIVCISVFFFNQVKGWSQKN